MASPALAASECAGFWANEDKSLIVYAAENARVDGKTYEMRGCGSGLVCSIDHDASGKEIPGLVHIDATQLRASTVVLWYDHPELGRVQLKELCPKL